MQCFFSLIVLSLFSFSLIAVLSLFSDERVWQEVWGVARWATPFLCSQRLFLASLILSVSTERPFGPTVSVPAMARSTQSQNSWAKSSEVCSGASLTLFDT